MNNVKYNILLIFSILTVIIATVAVTYAYLSFNRTQTNPNSISTGCFQIDFTDSNSINITSYPMSSDTAFQTLTPYTFTITNTCSTSMVDYQVFLNILNNTDENLLHYINYSLDGQTVNKLEDLVETPLPNGASSNNVFISYSLDTGSLSNTNTQQTYELYLWIDETAGNDIMGSSFQAEVMVYNVAR